MHLWYIYVYNYSFFLELTASAYDFRVHTVVLFIVIAENIPQQTLRSVYELTILNQI